MSSNVHFTMPDVTLSGPSLTDLVDMQRFLADDKYRRRLNTHHTRTATEADLVSNSPYNAFIPPFNQTAAIGQKPSQAWDVVPRTQCVEVGTLRDSASSSSERRAVYMTYSVALTGRASRANAAMAPILFASPFKSSGGQYSERPLSQNWTIVTNWRRVDFLTHFTGNNLVATWKLLKDHLDELWEDQEDPYKYFVLPKAEDCVWGQFAFYV